MVYHSSLFSNFLYLHVIIGEGLRIVGCKSSRDFLQGWVMKRLSHDRKRYREDINTIRGLKIDRTYFFGLNPDY